MPEIGIVTKQSGEYVTVRLERQEACAKCRACTAGLTSKDMIVEAENRCQAKVGDAVAISLEQSNFLQAVFIMYTIPLIFLFVGLGIGYGIGHALQLGNTELLPIVCGFVLLTAAYFLIRANEEKWRSKKFRPVAETVVHEKEL